MFLYGCGSNSWERQTSVRSPDGDLAAVVEHKNSAACCSDHSRLRLVELSEDTLDETPGVVVKATRARLQAHWKNNDRLIVEACGATNYEVTARVYRKDIMLPDGSENAVRIEVVSIPDTTHNGQVYCASNPASQ